MARAADPKRHPAPVPGGCKKAHRVNPGDIPDSRDMELTAGFLKALAHPLRLKILIILARTGTCICACDFEEYLSTNQPTVAHHLRILRSAGAIRAKKSGTWVYYFIDEGMLPLLSAAHRMNADGRNGKQASLLVGAARPTAKRKVTR